MPTYKITEQVHYSGNETVTYEIEADDMADAEEKSENVDLADKLGYWNVDVDVDSTEIELVKEPRCDKTMELEI